MHFHTVYFPTTAQEAEHAEYIRYQVTLAVHAEAKRSSITISEAVAEKLARAAVLSYIAAMEETRH
jgi:hypothetical protein